MKMKIFFPPMIIIIFVILPGFVACQPYLTENVSWESELEPVQWAQLVSGDINNDDLIDVIVMGCSGGTGGICNSYATEVYTNNGTSLLENSTWNQNITQVHLGSLVLGDIDNDGDLDLISSGCNNGGGQATECNSGGFQTKVYTNNGASFLENATWKGNIMDIWYSSMALGDIDNDGDLDLIISGENEILSKVTKIYSNNGTSFIENATWELNLPGMYEGAVVFGDIDNDYDLDLILSGENGTTSKITSVYINNGTTFLENSTWEQSLLAVDESSLALGDFNNDGNLDLTLTGCCDKHRIYVNNKTTFIEIQRDIQDLVGIFQSSQSFGDYDNDGDLDLITAGREEYTTLYLFNKSSNNFTSFPHDPESQIMDLEYTPSIIWTDLDNDMDLDIIEVGWGGGGGGWFQAKVYTNNITTPNQAPSAPTNDYNSTFNFSKGKLTLSWGNGSDAKTTTLGLYYNLRVGLTPGGHEVVSGVFGGGDDNGYFGNMMQRKSITLNRPDLENKTIYWAVQTIDTGLVKSAWSTEQIYNITQNASQSCIENWIYGEWSSCINSQQTRTATDSNNCGTTTNRSATTQSCSSYTPPSGGGTYIQPATQNQTNTTDSNTGSSGTTSANASENESSGANTGSNVNGSGQSVKLCVPFDVKCDGDSLMECVASEMAWVVKHVCEFGCENNECKEKPKGLIDYVWIILPAAVIAIAAAGLYFSKIRRRAI